MTCDQRAGVKCVFTFYDGCKFELVRCIPSTSQLDICSALTSIQQTLKADRSCLRHINIYENSCMNSCVVKPLQLANMCGKIWHTTKTELFNESVLPMVHTVRTEFGWCESVFSEHANIQTTQNGTSLIKAARNVAALQVLLNHVFKPERIHSIRIHNIMCTAQIKHFVSPRNCRILQLLQNTFDCNCNETLLLDDHMFAHSFLLDKFSTTCLQQYSLFDVSLKSVRINICRTGIVNFFVAIPGGIDLDDKPDKLVFPLLTNILSVVELAT